MRTRTSFQKRQKEIARAEKQRDKAAKRMQKKLMAKQHPEGEGEGEPADSDETIEGQPGPVDTEPSA
jgi:hypothetical protein